MNRLICILMFTASSLVLAADKTERVQLALEMIHVSSPSNAVAEIRSELCVTMPNLRRFPDSCDRFIKKQTPVIMDACARGFATELSESEIRELTALFKRPVMQKYFRVQEDVKAQALASFEKHLDAHPEIRDQFADDMIKEQKRRQGEPNTSLHGSTESRASASSSAP
jgi:hypothetical protein